jgi:hypothetical protein
VTFDCLSCDRRLELSVGYTANGSIAFDPEFGRAWLICPRCGTWNLLPMEERWEILASCEKRFAMAISRVSVSGIAQAEAADGQSLIRIGKTSNADLARFRYVDTLPAIEKRKQWTRIAGGAAFLALNVVAVLAGSVSLTSLIMRVVPLTSRISANLLSCLLVLGLDAILLRIWFRLGLAVRLKRPFLTINSGSGPAVMRWNQVRYTALCSTIAEPSWSLRLVHEKGESEFTGAAAEFYLATILSRVPHQRYSQSDLDHALQLISARGGSNAFLESFALSLGVESDSSSRICVDLMPSPPLHKLAAAVAANECIDRRESETEIDLLRQTAANASEIASIADELLIPDAVTDALQYLRSKLKSRPESPDA